MKLTVVTGNVHKAEEVAAFFGGSLDVSHVALDIPELRSEEIGTISRAKAQFAYDRLRTPLIVDDTGFFIDALNGFPGPYAGFVLTTIGVPGILKLMEGVKDRDARFTTAIGYADENGVRVFSGTLHGTITASPRGARGFGYDPVFAVEGRTLAEFPLEEKSRISHRGLALASFRDWFTGSDGPASP